jgi:hypothetical protein
LLSWRVFEPLARRPLSLLGRSPRLFRSTLDCQQKALRSRSLSGAMKTIDERFDATLPSRSAAHAVQQAWNNTVSTCSSSRRWVPDVRPTESLSGKALAFLALEAFQLKAFAQPTWLAEASQDCLAYRKGSAKSPPSCSRGPKPSMIFDFARLTHHNADG